MTIEKLMPASGLDKDLVEKLKHLLPETVADGKINWESLKELLGEHLEDEGEVEHFGLTWPGKRQSRRLASMPSTGTLVPVLRDGINEEETDNIFIEGDNLEVLKILQKSYAGRIKLIYIDPPYNTGNDFLYKDDYSEPLESYLQKTGQADQEGQLLTTNPKIGGRFHSNWLNMMYPRLRIARNLLREDGVIFISIDEHESYHLRILLNEVFGEENFITDIAWQRKYSVSNNFKGIASIRESILVYSQSNLFVNGLLPRTEESKARYANPDKDPRGPWKPVDYWNQASPEKRPNLVYTITNPNTGKTIFPEKKAWKYSLETHQKHIEENRIWWGVDKSNTVPSLKLFLSEVRDGLIPHNWWTHDESGNTDEAKKELEKLFDVAPFDTPKPTRLLKKIIQIANVAEDDIVLDFFAGSGTTAQAVLELNNEDGIKRNFILVQLPELINNQIFSSIVQVGKERIRRVIKKQIFEESEKSNLHHKQKIDRGFKVFTLKSSSIKKWENHEGNDITAFQTSLFNLENALIEGWEEADVISEIQLLQGFPLNSKIEQDSKFSNNRVHRVSSEYIGYKLFICLEANLNSITTEQIKAVLSSEDIFICLDQSLTDEAKLQLTDNHNVKTI
ncbi:site-specific DNA-methyltransferase [Nostoc sp.]|uniref:site-specific DNA-methyltransferase n=1 Tax=Nostoc sp. TaxID=1180 RepID=UPI002FF90CFD